MEEKIKELQTMWQNNCEKFIKKGVLIEDPNTTYISDNVDAPALVTINVVSFIRPANPSTYGTIFTLSGNFKSFSLS